MARGITFHSNPARYVASAKESLVMSIPSHSGLFKCSSFQDTFRMCCTRAKQTLTLLKVSDISITAR